MMMVMMIMLMMVLQVFEVTSPSGSGMTCFGNQFIYYHAWYLMKLLKRDSIWTFSLHICTKMMKDLDEMRDQDTSKNLELHKEET